MNVIKVVQFDEQKAKEELKKCPKIVRDYVKLLIKHQDNWKDIAYKAISKLKNTPQHSAHRVDGDL